MTKIDDAWFENAKSVLLSPEFQAQLSQAIADAREMSDQLDKARKLSFEDMNTPINI